MVTKTIEQETKLIPLDDKFNETLQQLVAEGWEIQPGVKPMAIYYLIRDPNRAKPGDEMGAIAKISVDPTKVGIIRAGEPDKVEWPDGTKTPV